MSAHDQRDLDAARALLASLTNPPEKVVASIAGHIARLRERAVDRACEVHERADGEYAAGYAAAVADIKQMALDNANRLSAEMVKVRSKAFRREYANSAELLLNFCQAMTDGAHVGAAKRDLARGVKGL